MPLSQLKESKAVPWKTADWVEAEQWLLGGPLGGKVRN